MGTSFEILSLASNKTLIVSHVLISSLWYFVTENFGLWHALLSFSWILLGCVWSQTSWTRVIWGDESFVRFTIRYKEALTSLLDHCHSCCRCCCCCWELQFPRFAPVSVESNPTFSSRMETGYDVVLVSLLYRICGRLRVWKLQWEEENVFVCIAYKSCIVLAWSVVR